jgi:hypothetical protein
MPVQTSRGGSEANYGPSQPHPNGTSPSRVTRFRVGRARGWLTVARVRDLCRSSSGASSLVRSALPSWRHRERRRWSGDGSRAASSPDRRRHRPARDTRRSVATPTLVAADPTACKRPKTRSISEASGHGERRTISCHAIGQLDVTRESSCRLTCGNVRPPVGIEPTTYALRVGFRAQVNPRSHHRDRGLSVVGVGC